MLERFRDSVGLTESAVAAVWGIAIGLLIGIPASAPFRTLVAVAALGAAMLLGAAHATGSWTLARPPRRPRPGSARRL